MERIINLLKEKREIRQASFIANSIIARQAKGDSPVPDTIDDLDMIIELSNAISILDKARVKKNVNSIIEAIRKL